MNHPYTEQVKKVNEDLKSIKIRDDIKLNLTDRQYSNLLFKAYDAGFDSANSLLESFVGDLTNWGHTNGSDERGLANDWYYRAFSMSVERSSFFRHYLFNFDYGIEAIKEMWENEDVFEQVYKEYIDESLSRNYETKEACLEVLKELIQIR